MKLDDHDKFLIVQLKFEGLSNKQIGIKFDVCHQTISKVLIDYDEKTNGHHRSELNLRADHCARRNKN